MYRAIVARRARAAWRHLGAGDYEYVLGQLAPSFSHSFAGDHALGGTRRTIDSQRAWFERLGRLLPGVAFTVEDVLVAGWPWRTRVAVILSVRAEIAGQDYENQLAQTLELRWGRITRIHTLEDTLKLAGALERLAASGIEEAGAAPISDPAPSGAPNPALRPRTA
jgi:ketosteroid isomerase-like protein